MWSKLWSQSFPYRHISFPENEKVLENIFDFTDAKLIISLSQNDIKDSYDKYYYVLQSSIKDNYSKNDQFSTHKSYTGAQMSLALLACGVNPQEL